MDEPVGGMLLANEVGNEIEWGRPMVEVDFEETSKALWEYFVLKIKELVDQKKETRTSISTKLAVHHGTVSRWYRGERGEGLQVPWHTTIDRLELLGVHVDEVLSDLEPEHAGMLIVFAMEYRDHMVKMAKIIKKKDGKLNHLLTTIDLLDEQGGGDD